MIAVKTAEGKAKVVDATFWLGVIVTTVLGIPAGILAIALHGRTVRYLDSRRVTSHARRVEAARRFYKVVQDLRTGRRDKYIYMLRGVLAITVTYIAGFIAIVMMGIIVALAPIPSSQWLPATEADWRLFGVIVFCLFSSALNFFLCWLSIRRWRDITNALEDFDAYKRDFISQWGEPPDETKDPAASQH